MKVRSNSVNETKDLDFYFNYKVHDVSVQVAGSAVTVSISESLDIRVKSPSVTLDKESLTKAIKTGMDTGYSQAKSKLSAQISKDSQVIDGILMYETDDLMEDLGEVVCDAFAKAIQKALGGKSVSWDSM